jgi:hypothetical protein
MTRKIRMQYFVCEAHKVVARCATYVYCWSPKVNYSLLISAALEKFCVSNIITLSVELCQMVLFERIKELIADVFFFVFLPAVVLVPLSAFGYMMYRMDHPEVRSWLDQLFYWLGF